MSLIISPEMLTQNLSPGLLSPSPVADWSPARVPSPLPVEDWSPAFFPQVDRSMDRSYGVSGRIMLSAVVILVTVVVLMIVLHLYARWYIHRTRRHMGRRTRNNARALVFNSEDPPRNIGEHQGLDQTVLKSLPVFEYSVVTVHSPLDCAVCLSEFTDGESGRTLPKCQHSFHTECIDMWFHSHSTCPLCRAPVELPEALTTVSELESASTSSGSSRKPPRPLNLSLEVHRSNGDSGFENSSGVESSPAQIRSPVGRIISRILSWERRPPTPPAVSSPVGCSQAEIDLECGLNESVQPQANDHTCQIEADTTSQNPVERV